MQELTVRGVREGWKEAVGTLQGVQLVDEDNKTLVRVEGSLNDVIERLCGLGCVGVEGNSEHGVLWVHGSCEEVAVAIERTPDVTGSMVLRTSGDLTVYKVSYTASGNVLSHLAKTLNDSYKTVAVTYATPKCLSFKPTEATRLPLTNNKFFVDVPLASLGPVPLSSCDPGKQLSHLSPHLCKAFLLRTSDPSPAGSVVDVAVLKSPTVHCKSCVSKIARRLKQLSLTPNNDFFYSLQDTTLYAKLSADVTLESLKKVLEDCQLPAAPRTVTQTVISFNVTNVVCNSCVVRIRRALRPRKVEVDIEAAVLKVWCLGHGDLEKEQEEVIGKVLDLKKFGIMLKEREDVVGEAPDVVRVGVAEDEVSGFDIYNTSAETSESPKPPPPPLSDAVTWVTMSFLIRGMTCASCAGRIEEHLSDLTRHVRSATVNFSTTVARVCFLVDGFGEEGVIAEVQSLGFEIRVMTNHAELRENLTHEKEISQKKHDAIIALSLALPLMFLMMIFSKIRYVHDNILNYHFYQGLTPTPFIQLLFATPVVVLYGKPFFLKAYVAVSHKTFTMDALVTLGVITPFVTSTVMLTQACFSEGKYTYVFHTASSLIAFMLLGKYIEYQAKSKTSAALINLMDLQPTRAILERDGTFIDVDVAEVAKNDRVRLIAGSSVPVDGKIVSGGVSVDESMITGESVPVVKHEGDKVAGGTLCIDGSAVVLATEVGSESCVSQILKLVNEAQVNKAPVQKYADKVAGIFVPCVITFAVVVFFTWLILGVLDLYPESYRGTDETPFAFAVNFLVSTLVIACPCAMGLATPTAVMVGTGVGAENGIFIKGGDALEMAHNVSCVVFDKTGTLSTGKIRVQKSDTRTGDSLTEIQLLSVVNAVEEQSVHPVAKAICNHICDPLPCVVTGHQTHHGKGVEAVVRVEETEVKVKIGSIRWLSNDVPQDVRETAEIWLSEGTTVVVAIVGDGYAVFAMSDEPKDEARATVKYLKAKGVEVYMVTGDGRAPAEKFARQVGISQRNVLSEMLPAEKAETVKALMTGAETGVDSDDIEMASITTQPLIHEDGKGKVVAFVGDGVNDTPALVEADVGIALGAGTTIAIDAADCVLTRSDLRDVVTFLSLSRTTMRRIKLNFFWAFGYNTIALPIAAGLLFPLCRYQLPPTFGGIAMICSSICVLLSSLHLRRFRPPHILPCAPSREL